MVTAWGRTVPFAVNAVTFLVSALLVSRIPEDRLRSAEQLTRGYWRDVADGYRLVVTSRPLRTVLIVWNIAMLGSAAVNVAEIEFAKSTLDAGNLGYAAFVAGSGAGLALGSFLSAPALGQVGLRRHYVGSIVLMGVGWGAAGLSGSIWLAVPFVIGGAAGNGAAVVCNRLFVQRGAPDRYRGRALATLMSSTYAIMGVGMAAAGVLIDAVGARAVWIAAGCLFLVAALVALIMTRWLPVVAADEQEAIASSAESAAAALSNGHDSEPYGISMRTGSVPAVSSGSRRFSRRSRPGASANRAGRPG